MEFRLEGKRVDVNTDRWDVGVVLEGLDFVEVATIADRETIVTVELEEGSNNRVLTGHTFNASDGVPRFEDGTVPEIRVVERLLSLPWVDNGIIATEVRVTLDNPDEFLTRVVEVELDLVTGGSNRFRASVLEDFNEVFMGSLGELTTFISVEVDVVDVEGGGGETSVGDTVTDDVVVAGVLGGIVPAEVTEVVEFEVNTNFVVLEGNEREGEAGIAVEPELEGDVESVFRGTLVDFIRSVGDARTAVSFAVITTLDEGVDELGDVTDHLGITSLLTGFLGEFVPDVEPITVVLVNALTTDFEFDTLDQVVARPVEPAELGTRAVGGLELNLGEGGLEVHAVD